MATDKFEICNIALSRIGVTTPVISAFDTSSQEAISSGLLYDAKIKQLLREFDWPFAKKYAQPTLVETFTDGDEEYNDWAYSYRYPTDCLRVRRVVTPQGQRENTPEAFSIGYDGTGRLVYTDQENAVIEYTALITDTTLHTPDFDSALAWLMACELIAPLGKDPARLYPYCRQQYALELDAARRGALNEREPHEEPDNDLIASRS